MESALIWHNHSVNSCFTQHHFHDALEFYPVMLRMFPGVSAYPELSTDVVSFFFDGVLGAVLNGDTKNHKLYWYRHTPADTMSALSSKLLDKCLALFTTTAYVVANMNNMMYKDCE